MHEVELAAAAQAVRDVQALPHPAVERRILAVRAGAHPVDLRGGTGVERREQRDVDAAGRQAVREQRHHLLPRSVRPRRGTPGHRSEQGHP